MGTSLTLSSTEAGTATRNGRAVGKAAFCHSLSGSYVGGAFVADAVLDADMLSGSITGFDIDGVKPDWTVELMKHAMTGAGIAVDAGAQTKWTIGETEGDASGSWSAEFCDTPVNQHQSSGVAGGFQAQYESDGFMVGSLGAERQQAFIYTAHEAPKPTVPTPPSVRRASLEASLTATQPALSSRPRTDAA